MEKKFIKDWDDSLEHKKGCRTLLCRSPFSFQDSPYLDHYFDLSLLADILQKSTFATLLTFSTSTITYYIFLTFEFLSSLWLKKYLSSDLRHALDTSQNSYKIGKTLLNTKKDVATPLCLFISRHPHLNLNLLTNLL